jgi:hypothetical protein
MYCPSYLASNDRVIVNAEFERVEMEDIGVELSCHLSQELRKPAETSGRMACLRTEI